VLEFQLRLGITAMPDDASIGDDSVGAEGIVAVFTGLLLFVVQELKIKNETNASINKLFMVFAPMR
jgi:hypothetical protein